MYNVFTCLILCFLLASSPPTTSSTPLSTVVTNTRQLGIKIVIEILRGPKGTFGFGLTSRDVSTNDEDIPIYVKSIQSDGPAFHDGRLKIGDRILEVHVIKYVKFHEGDGVIVTTRFFANPSS